ncbi:MAG: hypothetical protein ACT4QD_27000 [Acidobacteriota bacterium]
MTALLGTALMAGCHSTPASDQAPAVTPVYNTEDGRLQQLLADQDGDGRVDTRAVMDGRRLERIDLDRDGDGKADRWEYYTPPAVSSPPGSLPEIQRVEEANAPGATVTRREFYQRGQLRLVEDDADADGRVDRWEHYDGDRLVRIEMDLTGRGFPDQRFIYAPDGAVLRVEANPEGDGNWRLTPPTTGR